MKFQLCLKTSCGRLGQISLTHRLPSLDVETPVLLMHTRGGSIPHITHEVLQMITQESLVMHMPMSTLIYHLESIAEFDKGLAEFVGMKEYPVYITPQDPAVTTPPGYNLKNCVPIFSRVGKFNVNAESYMRAVEIMKPDMYLALCDGDTNINSSAKRITKSLQRSLHMFKDCLAYHNSSEALKDTAMLAPIEGGYDLKARKACIEEMAVQPVFGYVIDGLHNNGPEAEEITFESMNQVLSECIRLLPPEKLRVVHGAWNPMTLLNLVAAGFDAFDASLAYLCTERCAALCFPFKEDLLSNDSAPDHSICNGVQGDKKRHPYEIYVGDDRYSEDFGPLVNGCCCIACRQHSRAYLHHLLKTKELLGSILLMMHNLHYYLEFFKEIRSSIHNNSFEKLLKIVQDSCQK